MEKAEGFIYVGFAETKPMYTVEVEFPEGGLPGPSGEKVTRKISCTDPTFTELAFSQTPLGLSLKGNNLRYEIKVYSDGSREFSRTW